MAATRPASDSSSARIPQTGDIIGRLGQVIPDQGIGDAERVAHRIVNIYKGSRIIQQEYYKIDAAEPFQTIDCLKNDYIGLSGINMGRKNAN